MYLHVHPFKYLHKVKVGNSLIIKNHYEYYDTYSYDSVL